MGECAKGSATRRSRFVHSDSISTGSRSRSAQCLKLLHLQSAAAAHNRKDAEAIVLYLKSLNETRATAAK
jgi:hypothetical protein